MVLRRLDVCRLIDFNSWTAVQVWLDDVVQPAWVELVRDWLQPFRRRGQRSPLGTRATKDFFVEFADTFKTLVERRVSELENGVGGCPNKRDWNLRQHYEQFIIEAVALDRLSARRCPERNHIADRHWSAHPAELFANMYELTDAVCHNYWKPMVTEDWDSDDSDVPYTSAEDLPEALT